jgi:hypothetical protein
MTGWKLRVSRGREGKGARAARGERRIDAARGGLGVRRGQTLTGSRLPRSPPSPPPGTARHAPPGPRRLPAAAARPPPPAAAAAAARAVGRLRDPQGEAEGPDQAEGGGGPGESGEPGAAERAPWNPEGVSPTADAGCGVWVSRAPGSPALSESLGEGRPWICAYWSHGTRGETIMSDSRGLGGTPQSPGVAQ